MENLSREEQARVAARRVLVTPISERPERAEELGLLDPWTLLAVCHELDARGQNGVGAEMVHILAEQLVPFRMVSVEGRRSGLDFYVSARKWGLKSGGR